MIFDEAGAVVEKVQVSEDGQLIAAASAPARQVGEEGLLGDNNGFIFYIVKGKALLGG